MGLSGFAQGHTTTFWSTTTCKCNCIALFIFFFNSNSPKWLPSNWQVRTSHASSNSGWFSSISILEGCALTCNLPEAGWPEPKRWNRDNKCQSFWKSSKKSDQQDRRQQRTEESNLIKDIKSTVRELASILLKQILLYTDLNNQGTQGKVPPSWVGISQDLLVSLPLQYP